MESGDTLQLIINTFISPLSCVSQQSLVLIKTPWPTATMSTTAEEETSSAGRGATMTGPARERTAAGRTGVTGEREGTNLLKQTKYYV